MRLTIGNGPVPLTLLGFTVCHLPARSLAWVVVAGHSWLFPLTVKHHL